MSRYEEVEDWWGPGCQALLCQVLPLLPRKYEKPDTQAKPITIHLRAAQEKQNWLPVSNKVTLWSARYSACVVYTKATNHLSVGEKGGY